MSSRTHHLVEQSLAAVGMEEREGNHVVLQPILTDLIAFGLTVKQLHWNVVGAFFRPLHLHLDEIHADVQEAVDAVAERLSTCGHSPEGKAKSVATATELSEVPSGFIRDEEVARLASHQIRELVGLIRSRMERVENVDTVTADLLHQIVGKLEKHHWMLAAQCV